MEADLVGAPHPRESWGPCLSCIEFARLSFCLADRPPGVDIWGWGGRGCKRAVSENLLVSERLKSGRGGLTLWVSFLISPWMQSSASLRL